MFTNKYLKKNTARCARYPPDLARIEFMLCVATLIFIIKWVRTARNVSTLNYCKMTAQRRHTHMCNLSCYQFDTSARPRFSPCGHLQPSPNVCQVESLLHVYEEHRQTFDDRRATHAGSWYTTDCQYAT